MRLRSTLLLALISAPLAAQSNAERVLSGGYTWSHDYDLLHQRIEVRNFDWDSLAFDGAIKTTAVSLRPGLDSLILDMAKWLQVRSVTGAAGAKLDFTHTSDSLVVRFPRPAGFRDTLRFTVNYYGKVEQGRGLYFFKEEPGRPHRPQQVYSGGGTDGNPRWLPTFGGPTDKETWELVATVPTRYTVVSNGRLVSDRRVAGGQHTVHWSQERPASTYLISLVVAPLVKVTDRWRKVPLEYYVYPEDSALARPLFGVTPDMMEVYTKLTGVPYPWAKYAQTTVADFIGGMENVSATTLVDWLPDRRAYLDRPWYQHSLIPHELAHQWFGDLVTTENWANYWLNEGMAEFMPGQYWGVKRGRRVEDDYYIDEYRKYIQTDARKRMPLATYNSNNVYPKGALVLQMLKKLLGPDRFWAAINRYLTRHAYGTATSDDLRQAVLDATGLNLGWFWSQWIYQAGYPQFVVSAAYDSAGSSLTLTVKQTQIDTAKADSSGFRFTVPQVFTAPVSIRVRTAQGGSDVVARRLIDRREQTFRIDGVRGQPTMVVFDDDNSILKALDFDQPTLWLANQLGTQEDLWNRDWAIQQLGQRTADTLAAAALSRAALTADYDLTRASAAGWLRGFPASVALPALTAALRDTSSRVREATVQALGAVGGRPAWDLVRGAWKDDPSYEVRAAALTGLARLSPDGSRDAVLLGLTTPSYRDAIQNAAIVAVLQHPDAGLISELDRIAGQQPFPTVALALLGARGQKLASDAIVQRLDDERSWVRTWALDALSQELDPNDALAQLRDALPRVQREDVRAAVSDAIRRLEAVSSKQ
ncbi:MAG TPA: M1 family aminopeptidase [Gemmatimonadales bacterium]